MFFLFLGEIGCTATLVNPRWNKGDMMWKKLLCLSTEPLRQFSLSASQCSLSSRFYWPRVQMCVQQNRIRWREVWKRYSIFKIYMKNGKTITEKVMRTWKKKKLETSMSDARKIKIDHSLKGLFGANVNISSGHSVTKLFRRKSKSIFAKSKVLSS